MENFKITLTDTDNGIELDIYDPVMPNVQIKFTKDEMMRCRAYELLRDSERMLRVAKTEFRKEFLFK